MGLCTTLRAPPGNIQLGCLSLSLSLSLVLELLRLKTVQFSHNDGLLPSLRVQSGVSTVRMMSESSAVVLSLVLLGNLGICVESD